MRVLAPNPSVMTGSGTNSYLLGTGEIAAVDPGPDVPAHLEALVTAAAGRLCYVLVTHHHLDHAPGARRLAELTGATLLAAGYGGFDPDGVLRDGDIVRIPGWRIEAVHTPGHASDHLCFLADREPGISRGNDRVLFSGDHVMGGSTVVIEPPDGSMTAYLESLGRLLRLDPPLDAIVPGHGNLIADPQRVLADYLEHRLQRERAVEAALAAGPATPDALVASVYGNIAAALHRPAASTIWAHLRRLAEEGRAWSATPDDRAGRWFGGSIGSSTGSSTP